MRSRSFTALLVLVVSLVASPVLAEPTAKAVFSIKDDHVFQRMPVNVELENEQQISNFELKFRFTEASSGKGVLPGMVVYHPSGWLGIFSASPDGTLAVHCWRTQGSNRILKGERLIAQIYFNESPMKIIVNMSARANGKQATAIAPGRLDIYPPLPPPPPLFIPLPALPVPLPIGGKGGIVVPL